MTDLFDRLGPLRFDGEGIPCLGYSVSGGQRNKDHYYPHVNSGKSEKLGRALYTVRIQALFDTSQDAQYPGIFPEVLNALLRKFETGVTGALFLPTRGTLLAYCDTWTTEMSALVRSGERADLTFKEDDETGFTVNDFSVFTGASFQAKALTLAELQAAYASEMSEADADIFAKIDAAANVVRGAIDTGELVTSAILAKVERLVGMCAEVERDVQIIADPRAYPLFEAVKDLWEAGAKVAEDVKGKRAPVDTYTVPATMALSQVSLAIYGDATRGGSLLDLNFFSDAFAIPAGTSVRFYPDEL